MRMWDVKCHLCDITHTAAIPTGCQKQEYWWRNHIYSNPKFGIIFSQLIQIFETLQKSIVSIAYHLHRCIKSCSTIIFKMPVSLAEKIKVKVYANEDDFVSEIQALPRLWFLLCFPHELLMIWSSITIVSTIAGFQSADNSPWILLSGPK